MDKRQVVFGWALTLIGIGLLIISTLIDQYVSGPVKDFNAVVMPLPIVGLIGFGLLYFVGGLFGRNPIDVMIGMPKKED